MVDGHNGVVVSLVAPSGERSMASDRGVAPLLRADELEMRWLGGAEWLHVTGYALFRSPIDEAAAKAAGAVRAQGGRISVDLSSWSMIRDFGPERLVDRLRLLEPDVVFGNVEELDAIGGSFPANDWVLKLGPDGVELSDGRRLPGACGRRARHDRRRRRACGRLPGRRRRARAGGRRALRREARDDAVVKVSPASGSGRGRCSTRGATNLPTTSTTARTTPSRTPSASSSCVTTRATFSASTTSTSGRHVVEIGLGLRPDLTGRGLGLQFFLGRCLVREATFGDERVVLNVAAFNERAITVYRRAGFRETGRHMRTFERWGEVEFLEMEEDR